MLSTADLTSIARARLKDAKALLSKKRYDGAAYLCGYAVEIALKARIVRTLKWSGFPETRTEFEGLASFRCHDLDILLHLSGWEERRFWPSGRRFNSGIQSRATSDRDG